MNDKSEGIVLKQSDFKDNDYLLNVMTPEFGRLSLVAKGAKKAQSKNSYACSPLTLAAYLFDYRYSFSIHILHSTTVIDTFKNIREDLMKISAANIMVDTVNYITQECEDDVVFNHQVYQLLKDCLFYLNNNDHLYITLGVFLSNILIILGIGSQVDGCSKCDSDKITGISIADGGFVCAKCGSEINNHDILFLKQFRLLNKAKPCNFTALEAYEPYDFGLIEILYQYLSEYGDVHLSSWTFFKDLITKK